MRLLIQRLPGAVAQNVGRLGSPGEGPKYSIIDQFSLSVRAGPGQRSGGDSPGGWSLALAAHDGAWPRPGQAGPSGSGLSSLPLSAGGLPSCQVHPLFSASPFLCTAGGHSLGLGARLPIFQSCHPTGHGDACCSSVSSGMRGPHLGGIRSLFPRLPEAPAVPRARVLQRPGGGCVLCPPTLCSPQARHPDDQPRGSVLPQTGLGVWLCESGTTWA